MRLIRLVAVFVGCVLATNILCAQTSQPAHTKEILGTWRQISATVDGKPVERAEGATTLMHITPTQFTQIGIAKDKTIVVAAGGPYRLVDDELRETLEYTTAGAKKLEGETLTYHCKFDGTRLTLSGSIHGVQGDEIWQRDDSK